MGIVMCNVALCQLSSTLPVTLGFPGANLQHHLATCCLSHHVITVHFHALLTLSVPTKIV